MSKKTRWTDSEQAALVECVKRVGRDWVKVSAQLTAVHKMAKTVKQCADK